MKMASMILPVLAGSLLLAGCSSTQDKGPYAPAAVKNNLENTERFVLLDPGAQYSVTCTGIQEMRLADGRLQVAANVKNRENRRIQVQIDCVFKDGAGFALDEAPYQTLILDENATQSVQFTSLNDRALRYTIRVRQAR
jgi:uncharacterized protein YcfL